MAKQKIDYNKLSDTEITAEIIAEYKKNKIKEQKNNIKKSFFDAKEEAIKIFEKQKDVEKQELLKVWQTAEDNNYVIPE